jgi:hypothetical protein
MSLPATVRVKISSEAAEAISITRVVVQDLPLRELIEYMLAITGKDTPRIRELLRRGTLVSGASRFRWTGWEAQSDAIDELLASFPDPEPARPFAAERCIRAVLHGGRQAIPVPREAAARKPLWHKTSFWAHLMNVVGAGRLAYLHYSYKDRADCYRLELSPAEAENLRAAADSVRYTTMRDQIRSAALVWVELYVDREAAATN